LSVIQSALARTSTRTLSPAISVSELVIGHDPTVRI
jgi:hypothetical protein